MWTRALAAIGTAALMMGMGVGVGGCDSLFGIGTLPPLPGAGDASTASDAGDGQAAAAPSYCATLSDAARPWFCADFDENADVTAGFDDESASLQNTAGGGKLEADEERFLSPPRAARMSLPVLLQGARGLAHLQKSLPEGVRIFRVEAKVRIETEGFTEDTGVYTFFQIALPPTGGITVSRGRQGTYVDTIPFSGSQTSVLLKEPMSVGVWYPLRLLVELPTSAAKAGEIEVLIDGVPGGSTPIPYSLSGGSTPVLGVGMIGMGPIRRAEVSFDDVRIEIID